ncbi:Integration host factor subunit alpha [Bienertia sinuspersici]
MAPTNTQRLEQVEGELAALRTSVSEQVASAVSTASQELQQTLTTQIAKSLEEATQKLGEDLSMRLEGRITRSRENQEVMITQLRQEHVALRDEVRKTLSAGQKNGESSIGGGSNFELREKEVNDGSFDGGGANWHIRSLTCHSLTALTLMVGFYGQKGTLNFIAKRRGKARGSHCCSGR